MERMIWKDGTKGKRIENMLEEINDGAEIIYLWGATVF